MSGHDVPSGEAAFAVPANVKGTPWGVVWSGPWSAPGESLAQVARRTVIGIEAAGVPVLINMEYMSGATLADYDQSVLKELGCPVDTEAMARYAEDHPDERVPTILLPGGMLNRVLDRILVEIHHSISESRKIRPILYPHSYQYVDRVEMEKLHRYKILMTVLERDRLTNEERSLYSRFGQVWVPCSSNKRAMVKGGVPEEKVRVVPHPMPMERLMSLRGAKEQLGRGKPSDGRSYVFYNIGKWEPRKNQRAIIQSFLCGFKPDGSARLLLKTSKYGDWSDYPKSPYDCVAESLGLPGAKENGWTPELARKYVGIQTEHVEEGKILQLHALGDCYVSASHGEGWDMPSFDAMCAGNHLISPRVGWFEDALEGHIERPGDLFTVIETTETEPCHRAYGWGLSRWLKVWDESVLSAMRSAFYGKKSGDGVTIPAFFPTQNAVGAMCVRNILECAGVTYEEACEKWGTP